MHALSVISRYSIICQNFRKFIEKIRCLNYKLSRYTLIITENCMIFQNFLQPLPKKCAEKGCLIPPPSQSEIPLSRHSRERTTIRWSRTCRRCRCRCWQQCCRWCWRRRRRWCYPERCNMALTRGHRFFAAVPCSFLSSYAESVSIIFLKNPWGWVKKL